MVSKHYSDGPCSAVLGGLSHFNDRVVYVDVEDSPNKKKLQDFVCMYLHSLLNVSLFKLNLLDDMYLPFKEAGLTCDDMKPLSWTPHSTIMKLSAGKQHKKHKKHGNNNDQKSEKESGDVTMTETTGVPSSSSNLPSTITPAPIYYPPVHKIDKTSYAEHKEIKFGEQIFAGIELSAMAAVDPDGYYKCLHKQPFIIVTSSSSPTSFSSSTTSTSTSTSN